MASSVSSIRCGLKVCSRRILVRPIEQRGRLFAQGSRQLSTSAALRSDDELSKRAREQFAGDEDEVKEDGMTRLRRVLETEVNEGRMSRFESATIMQQKEEARYAMKDLAKVHKASPDSLWSDGEPDEDLILPPQHDVVEDFDEDEITSLGHAKLEEHREARAYARAAAWEMPLLSRFAKPFQPPRADQVLRFRYTTYMGEFHPAEKKVVVQFCPSDLPITEAQQMKLRKLAGTRWNPEKDIVKMSCERFEHQAQNKRYLGDLVEKMVAEAKDTTDTLEDIPLDTRHHHFKVKPKFPVKWRMTEERRQELSALREQSYQLDASKRAEGSLIDGAQAISLSLNPPTPGMARPEAVKQQISVAALLSSRTGQHTGAARNLPPRPARFS